MAVILVLVCGAMGFTSALAALLIFDASPLQAFGLWAAGGLLALVLTLIPALLPRPATSQDRTAETA